MILAVSRKYIFKKCCLKAYQESVLFLHRDSVIISYEYIRITLGDVNDKNRRFERSFEQRFFPVYTIAYARAEARFV